MYDVNMDTMYKDMFEWDQAKAKTNAILRCRHLMPLEFAPSFE